MQLALPVIMLLMILVALGTLLLSAPEVGQPLDALTTSGISDPRDAPSSPPQR